jgi:hypothetical protein
MSRRLPGENSLKKRAETHRNQGGEFGMASWQNRAPLS